MNNDTPAPPESSAALAEGDVQKKITPWTNPGSVAAELFPGSTILSNGAPRLSSQSRNREGERSGLVLVASLLNKIPNLGGKERMDVCQWDVVVCPLQPLNKLIWLM